MKFIKQGSVTGGNAEFNGIIIMSPIPGAYASKYVEFDDRIVVEFWAEKEIELGEQNVFAFNPDGTVLWQIERFLKIPVKRENEEPFVSLRFSLQDQITYVNTWGGNQAILNINDGRIERIKLTRSW